MAAGVGLGVAAPAAPPRRNRAVKFGERPESTFRTLSAKTGSERSSAGLAAMPGVKAAAVLTPVTSGGEGGDDLAAVAGGVGGCGRR